MRVHYSHEFVRKILPGKPDHHTEGMKPGGFWYSVQEAEPDWNGWLQWCRDEEFRQP